MKQLKYAKCFKRDSMAIGLIVALALVAVAMPARAGLVSHWSFDSNYADSTANNNGTLVDTGTAGNAGIDTTTKRFGAGSFSSGDDQDRIAVSSTVLAADADGYTISLWLKQTTSDANGIALGVAGAGSFIWKHLGIYDFNTDGDFSGFNDADDTEWHHLVLVNNGTTAGSTIYIDNVEQTTAGSGVAPGSLDAAFTFDRLGAGYTQYGLVGNLDEVWVFDSALTRTEVGSLFQYNDPDVGAFDPGISAISSPSTRAIIQRDASNLGTLPIVGTYSGSIDGVEARMIVMTGADNSGAATTWATIDDSPSDGVFSGTLSGISAGGWYTLEVRSVTGGVPGRVVSVERVGVGDIFIIAGQSNAGSYGTPRATPEDDRVSRLTSTVSGTWTKASDPMSPPNGLSADGGGGSAWTRLGDLLTAMDDVPVGFVCIAAGSSALFQWLPNTSYHTTRSRPAVQHFPSNGFRAVLWHQGEGDAFYETTADAYKSMLAQIIAQSRADAGWDVPWYIAEASAVGGTSNFKGIPVLAGQRATVFADTNVFLGPTSNEFYLEQKTHDGTHFNGAGLLDHATQWRDILGGNTTLDVENHDFERNVTPAITGTDALADGVFYTIDHDAVGDPSILDWRELSASGVVKPDGDTGYYNPGSSQYSNAVDTINGGVMVHMDGKHVAFLTGGSAGNHVLQYRRTDLLANHVYTLTVAVGVRDGGTDVFGGARIDILANGQVLGTGKTVALGDLDALAGGSASGTFTDVTYAFTTADSVADNQSVGVRITKVDGGTATYLDFDNVRLTAQRVNQEGTLVVLAKLLSPAFLTWVLSTESRF